MIFTFNNSEQSSEQQNTIAIPPLQVTTKRRRGWTPEGDGFEALLYIEANEKLGFAYRLSIDNKTLVLEPQNRIWLYPHLSKADRREIALFIGLKDLAHRANLLGYELSNCYLRVFSASESFLSEVREHFKRRGPKCGFREALEPFYYLQTVLVNGEDAPRIKGCAEFGVN